MKEHELLERISEKTLFSIQDVQRIGGFSREYSKLILNRLIKRRLIKKAGRNKYTTKNDIYAVASNLKVPSYISFWSASAYYGFSDQLLSTVFVASQKKFKDAFFQGYKIKFVPTQVFGYKKIISSEGEIFIAEHEKLLIDSVIHFREMGNFDEIENIFKKCDFEKEKLVEYFKRMNRDSAIKRAGFLLEKHRGVDISKYFKLGKNYYFLNPFSKKHNAIDSKWRLKI